MRVIFLVGELVENAGATRDLSRLISDLRHLDSNFTYRLIVFRRVAGSSESINGPGGLDRSVTDYFGRYYSLFLGNSRLARLISDFDVVYVKQAFPPLIPAKQSGRPCVLSLPHIDPPFSFGGTRGLLTAGTYALSQVMLRIPDKVIATSQEGAEYLRQRTGIDPCVIPDSIDPEFLMARSRPAPDLVSRPLRLLAVGEWDGPKGRRRHHLLINLVSRLDRTRLKIVGLTPPSILALRQILNRTVREDFCDLIGVLSTAELRRAYLECDLVVIDSTFEGFCRPLIEGFATAAPAVVLNSMRFTSNPALTASVNHIKRSGAGAVYDPSSASLAQALEIVKTNYELLSRNALEYAAQFTGQSSAVRLLDLFLALR
jgi:glycosyltransferase involved in cell wall biosynthesis